MKNVLFYYDNYCAVDSHGGTEVATARIASALHQTGLYRVYSAFLKGKPGEDCRPYNMIIRLKKAGTSFERELASFIKDNDIDFVVNMGRFFRQKRLQTAIRRSGRSVKLLFMHHFAPGSEIVKPTYRSGWHLLKLDPANPLYWLRATVYPLLKLPRTLNWKSAYRNVLEISDAIILLSKGYIPQYLSIAGIKRDNGKFHALPNIFDFSGKEVHPAHKEKRVLILSRMDEIQKRITVALEIWKKIESEPALQEWRLDIVGNGHDYSALMKKAKSMGLRRVTFHGWANGKAYLAKDSILMSTSLYEGLSLAMIEAQALGCVPIAFNSYASLTDIVENGLNGVTVEHFGDTNSYAAALRRLMADKETRLALSDAGRLNASRFSSATIGRRWHSLLNSL